MEDNFIEKYLMSNVGIDNLEKLDKQNSPEMHMNKPIASTFLSFITPKIASHHFPTNQLNNNTNATNNANNNNLNGFD